MKGETMLPDGVLSTKMVVFLDSIEDELDWGPKLAHCTLAFLMGQAAARQKKFTYEEWLNLLVTNKVNLRELIKRSKNFRPCNTKGGYLVFRNFNTWLVKYLKTQVSRHKARFLKSLRAG